VRRIAIVAACVAVTISATLLPEQIDSAASSIAELVRMAKTVTGSWRMPAVAEAQVPELKTRTQEITAVLESRRARSSRVAAALAAGCLGEDNQGLVEPRPASGCPPDVATLAADENRDRLALYRTLVEQDKMPPGDLTRVQAAFARATRERVPAGTWVQDEAGRWSRK